MKIIKRIVKESDKVTKNILDKCFTMYYPNKEIELHDAAILGLLEDMIGKTLSLITLVENKNYNTLDAIARMMFENFIYLKFMLEKDTSNRGAAYIYSLKRRELRIFDSIAEQTLVGSKVRSFLNIKRDKFITDFPKFSDLNYKEEIETFNPYDKKVKTQKWYNFNGRINNLRKLSAYLDIEDQYILLYQIFSGEVHAQESLKYFHFEENYVTVLRKEVDSKTHISIASNFMIETIRSVYSYYGLKEEIKVFNNIIAANYRYK